MPTFEGVYNKYVIANSEEEALLVLQENVKGVFLLEVNECPDEE